MGHPPSLSHIRQQWADVGHRPAFWGDFRSHGHGVLILFLVQLRFHHSILELTGEGCKEYFSESFGVMIPD